MTPQNGYLVDWERTHVGPGAEIYPPEGTWAEPDLDHAAALMRHVVEHPDEARARGVRARSDIERSFAPAVTGAIARGRLERLHESRGESTPTVGSPGGAHGLSSALQRVETALNGFDLRNGSDQAPNGAASLMRRIVLRLMLPFTYHEREVDRSLVAAVRHFGSELGAERARARRDRVRLRQAEVALERLRDTARATDAAD
jgi:hypothetical protein